MRIQLVVSNIYLFNRWDGGWPSVYFAYTREEQVDNAASINSGVRNHFPDSKFVGTLYRYRVPSVISQKAWSHICNSLDSLIFIKLPIISFSVWTCRKRLSTSSSGGDRAYLFGRFHKVFPVRNNHVGTSVPTSCASTCPSSSPASIHVYRIRIELPAESIY
jgi:hypothetical protein